MRVLGIDTSNYTTSAAIASEEGLFENRKVLSVGKGECGLRQSNALFLHTVNIPEIMRALSPMGTIDAVAYSAYPRDVEGSYMPCFLAGQAAAETAAAVLSVPLYRFSHQAGHIMAAVKSCGNEEIARGEFLAFHASGGTTEMLRAFPDEKIGFGAEILGATLDISVGKLIDRVGVMLGLTFPCGAALEELARKNTLAKMPMRVSMKGLDCNLSGAENMAKKMLEAGESPENIAQFAIFFAGETILAMSEAAREKYPELPIIFAGGVMCNATIRKKLSKKLSNIYFAAPALSSDNAAGVAYLGLEKLKRDKV